jgi:hypothetical protein
MTPTRGLAGGRYWVRTSDLFRVREARYRCANRPCEVETGFEPVYTDLQSVASPLGHSTGDFPPGDWARIRSERTTGFEPATLTLAR